MISHNPILMLFSLLPPLLRLPPSCCPLVTIRFSLYLGVCLFLFVPFTSLLYFLDFAYNQSLLYFNSPSQILLFKTKMLSDTKFLMVNNRKPLKLVSVDHDFPEVWSQALESLGEPERSRETSIWAQTTSGNSYSRDASATTPGPSPGTGAERAFHCPQTQKILPSSLPGWIPCGTYDTASRPLSQSLLRGCLEAKLMCVSWSQGKLGKSVWASVLWRWGHFQNTEGVLGGPRHDRCPPQSLLNNVSEGPDGPDSGADRGDEGEKIYLKDSEKAQH